MAPLGGGHGHGVTTRSAWGKSLGWLEDAAHLGWVPSSDSWSRHLRITSQLLLFLPSLPSSAMDTSRSLACSATLPPLVWEMGGRHSAIEAGISHGRAAIREASWGPCILQDRHPKAVQGAARKRHWAVSQALGRLVLGVPRDTPEVRLQCPLDSFHPATFLFPQLCCTCSLAGGWASARAQCSQGPNCRQAPYSPSR